MLNSHILLQMRVELTQPDWHTFLLGILEFPHAQANTYIDGINEQLRILTRRLATEYHVKLFEVAELEYEHAAIINAIHYALIEYLIKLVHNASLVTVAPEQDMQYKAILAINRILSIFPEFKSELINATDDEGISLLMWAVNYNLENIADLLINNGAFLHLCTTSMSIRGRYRPNECAAVLAFRLDYNPRFIAKLLTRENFAAIEKYLLTYDSYDAEIGNYLSTHEFYNFKWIQFCLSHVVNEEIKTNSLIPFLRNITRLIKIAIWHQTLPFIPNAFPIIIDAQATIKIEAVFYDLVSNRENAASIYSVVTHLERQPELVANLEAYFDDPVIATAINRWRHFHVQHLQAELRRNPALDLSRIRPRLLEPSRVLENEEDESEAHDLETSDVEEAKVAPQTSSEYSADHQSDGAAQNRRNSPTLSA